jgi:integrase
MTAERPAERNSHHPRVRANGEGSIYPYRSGYAAYVWVSTPGGEETREYVYGKTRDEVYEKWIKLRAATAGAPVPTTVPTVAQFLARWLTEVVQPNLEPATHAYYELMVRLYITPALGSKRLDGLQTRDVQAWLNKLARTCQCCAQGKDAARPEDRRRCCALGACCRDYPGRRTIQAARNTLRAALNHARLSGELVTRNAAAFAKAPTPPKRRCIGSVWSVEEAGRFLASAREDEDPLYAAYVLTLVNGLRRGETLGLTWPSIDLDGGEIEVAWQLQRIRGELIHKKRGKTGISKAGGTVPLAEICVAALKLRRDDQEVAREQAGNRWQQSDLVFTTKWGTPVEPRNFNRSFDARCTKAGVPRIRVHDTRHSCAALLVALDVHPRVAMRILRCAQIPMSMEVYDAVPDEAARAALRKLGDSLTGLPPAQRDLPPDENEFPPGEDERALGDEELS